MSKSKLTAEQKVREYNRGQKAAKKGRSLCWSDPSAYPFESNEPYQGRKRDVSRSIAYKPPDFPATQLRGYLAKGNRLPVSTQVNVVLSPGGR
jgi:hypothetical protein